MTLPIRLSPALLLLLMLVFSLPVEGQQESEGDAGSGAESSSIAVEKPSTHFQWGSALKESLSLLAIQHAIRMHEPKTRDNLGGAFFPEWFNAASNLHGWSDGDAAFTQYVGHPMQGAWASYIEIQNDPGGRTQEFQNAKSYWSSRLRALSFAAAYEVQWHLGPVSEASIGHVGKKNGTLAYSEFVTGPTGGFGLVVLEDVLDRRFVEKLEMHSRVPMQRFYRVAFAPNRSIANVLRLKRPWYRDTRPLNQTSSVPRERSPEQKKSFENPAQDQLSGAIGAM